MGRSTSPKWKRELANLENDDSQTRKSAMKVLKSHVTNMNPSSIPQFLSQVSDSKDLSHRTANYTISLYEVLARVHGPSIVPQIENIMSAILETLRSRSASISLHQACAKVVTSLARYCITPETPPEKKKKIIFSICKPLSDSLLGSQESLSSGSALCLGALVDSDNWRFSSDEMVNEVCLRITGCLEDKPKQTNSHMTLVMSLAKRNPLIVEAYSRLLIRSGLRMLNTGVVEGNSHKRLSAIQMVNFLMKWLDPQSVCSEVGVIVRDMNRCSSDHMAFVKGAALEALQTAMSISKSSSRTGGGGPLRTSRSGDPPSVPASPQSRTVGSFADLSPIFPRRIWCDLEQSGGRWLSEEGGGVDVSLKDGLFSELGDDLKGQLNDPDWEPVGFEGSDCDAKEDCFEGFAESYSENVVQMNVGDMIFETPRKLLRSLQKEEVVQGPEEQQGVDYPPPSWYESSPEESENGEKGPTEESVSSTDTVGPTPPVPHDQETLRLHRSGTGRNKGPGLGMLCSVLLIAASTVVASLMLVDGGNQEVFLVPT